MFSYPPRRAPRRKSTRINANQRQSTPPKQRKSTPNMMWKKTVLTTKGNSRKDKRETAERAKGKQQRGQQGNIKKDSRETSKMRYSQTAKREKEFAAASWTPPAAPPSPTAFSQCTLPSHPRSLFTPQRASLKF